MRPACRAAAGYRASNRFPVRVSADFFYKRLTEATQRAAVTYSSREASGFRVRWVQYEHNMQKNQSDSTTGAP